MHLDAPLAGVTAEGMGVQGVGCLGPEPVMGPCAGHSAPSHVAPSRTGGQWLGGGADPAHHLWRGQSPRIWNQGEMDFASKS